jgi:hypothetical protein
MSPVVTICTARLTFSNSTFCPHSVFVCFVWISEQTAIIYLYSIIWLVCTTETECVHCAVRTGSWNEIQFNFCLSRIKAYSYAPQFAALKYFICYPQRVNLEQPSNILNKICALRFRTCDSYLITLCIFRTQLSQYWTLRNNENNQCTHNTSL